LQGFGDNRAVADYLFLCDKLPCAGRQGNFLRPPAPETGAGIPAETGEKKPQPALRFHVEQKASNGQAPITAA
jgi:hypothetical protein